MELSNNFLSKRMKKSNFLCKEGLNKILAKRNLTLRMKQKLERSDSNSTVVDNLKISNTLNSDIMIRKLKPYPYARAESELRQILTKTTVNKNKSGELRKKSPIGRASGILKPSFRNIDVIGKDPKNNVKIWENFIDNFKDKNKSGIELIPISIRFKGIMKGKKKNNKLNIRPSVSPTEKRRETEATMFFAQDNSKKNTPDVKWTLKGISKNMTEDWHQSVLYYNLKYNRGSPEEFKGFYKKELEDLLEDPPSDPKAIKITIEKLFITIKKLLIQLLGTQDDFEQFKTLYSEPTEENIRKLIRKCLNFYEFRAKTAWVLENIIKREHAIKEIGFGNNKVLNLIFSLTKTVKKGIETWLSDACAPFTEFLYCGENYVDKMNKETAYFQSLVLG